MSSVTCWSYECPEFITYNYTQGQFEFDFSTKTDKDQQDGETSNYTEFEGVYIYIVYYTYMDKSFDKIGNEVWTQKQYVSTFTFEVYYWSENSYAPININLPWEEFYYENKNNPRYSRYKMTPPSSTNQDYLNDSSSDIDNMTDSETLFDYNNLPFPSSWSLEDLKQAFKDAEIRHSKYIEQG